MNLKPFSPVLMNAIQAFAARHGYTDCRQAVLGNGLSKFVVDNSAPPRQVWIRFGDSLDITDVAQATLGDDVNFPYLDTINNVNVSDQNIPCVVGRRPAVMGGESRLYVIALDSTLAGLSALGTVTPIWQLIYAAAALTVATADGSLVVSQVNQILVPPGSETNNGGGTVTLNYFWNIDSILTDSNGDVLSDSNGNVLVSP